MLAGGRPGRWRPRHLIVKPGRPLRVALDERVKVKRPGQPVVGTVVEPVYVYDRIVVPAGTKALGHVERIEGPSKGVRVGAALAGDFTPNRHVVLSFDRPRSSSTCRCLQAVDCGLRGQTPAAQDGRALLPSVRFL